MSFIFHYKAYVIGNDGSLCFFSKDYTVLSFKISKDNFIQIKTKEDGIVKIMCNANRWYDLLAQKANYNALVCEAKVKQYKEEQLKASPFRKKVLEKIIIPVYIGMQTRERSKENSYLKALDDYEYLCREGEYKIH